MGRIAESIDIAASPQSIWNYVQDYSRRTEWDTTVREYRPIGTDKVDKGVSVFIKSSGFPANEYEAVYVSFEPYKGSAIKLTKPIKNVIFKTFAGSWRYAAVANEHTRFTMTLEYELKMGFLDKLLVEPILRREIKKSLANLNRKFQPKQ